MLYALLDEQKVIQHEHLAAALEVWRYCADSARHALWTGNGKGVDRILNRVTDRMADKIATAIVQSGGEMSRSDIRKVVGGRLRAEEIEQALSVLEGRGYVRTVVPKGRNPLEVWHKV